MRHLTRYVLLLALVAAAAAFACQGYEFQQVTPKAIGAVKQGYPIAGVQKPAKIMFALDKSGSMKTTADSDTNWGCSTDLKTGAGYDPSGQCKWNSLKKLLVDSGTGFLDATQDSARHGLAIFPNKIAPPSDPCAAGSIYVPVGQAKGDTVALIKTQLGDVSPGGGTPSAAMLTSIGNDSEFVKEEPATKRYVVLVTDGLPNCNSNITLCTACTNIGGDPNAATPCGNKLNCLDDTFLVNAVKVLKAKGVETFVIGFGSAVAAGDCVPGQACAKDVLNRAADAGGQQSQTADPTKPRFYQAGSADDLSKVLDHIKLLLQQCNFALAQAPEKENLLEVSVTDTTGGGDTTLVKGTDWDFTSLPALNSVSIKGQWCSTLQSAPAGQYTLNFVSVNELK